MQHVDLLERLEHLVDLLGRATSRLLHLDFLQWFRVWGFRFGVDPLGRTTSRLLHLYFLR